MTTTDQHQGRVLGGRYRIETELGVGSSASVYLAHDTRLERRVAAKVLHPGLSTDSAFVRRLSAEARAVAMLNHPNIVHVYDWGQEPEGPYLIMEYLAGGSLKELLARDHRISASQAARMGAEAAKALSFAHQQGLVHRDIKPANLLFDVHGVVHIADFGLARTIAEAKWTEPTGVVLGTARYASPEQALSHPLNGASDVYSLALVLYEAITGEAPFAGETPLATLMNRVGRPLPPTAIAGPLMPILDAASRSLPTNRLSALELAQALEHLETQLPRPEPLQLPTAGSLGQRDRSFVAGDEETVVDDPIHADQTLLYGTHNLSDETVHTSSKEQPGRALHAQRRKRYLRFRLLRSTRGKVIFAIVLFLVAVLASALAVPRYLIFNRTVPRLTGLNLVSAEHLAQSNGLLFHIKKKEFSFSVPGGEIITQAPSSGQRERPKTTISVVLSLGPRPVNLPSILGTSKAFALRAITALHLVATTSAAYSESVPPGRVISTTPSKGTVPYGSKVAVLISKGPHPRTIPQLSSATYVNAKTQLTTLRLVPIRHLVYSSDVQQGTVISTVPAAGTTGIPVGSQVEVVVSKGPQMVVVPTVAGEPIAQAIANLQQAGLVVSEQIGPPFATVASVTNPPPGTAVAIHTSVTLYVA